MKVTTRALHAPDDDQIDDFNTVDFTAKKLKTNRKTIYDAIARKEIPAVKVGRLFRVPGSWLRQQAGLS